MRTSRVRNRGVSASLLGWEVAPAGPCRIILDRYTAMRDPIFQQLDLRP